MKLLLAIVFLWVGVVASQATITTPELYWNSVLPNTPMPGAVRNTLLAQGLRKGEINVVGTWDDINIYQCHPKAQHDQHMDNPNTALYLLEKDLVAGTQMVLNFTVSPNAATFWPREIVDSMPFSLKKLPEILNKLSLKPESKQATVIKTTLEECEVSSSRGDDFCATSLESMIDYSVSKMGKQVRALSTEVPNETVKQLYTFTTPGLRMIAPDNTISCHKLNYAHAVFFCHKVPSTSTYMVPLMGADGSTAKAVAVCHKDTSSWSPESVPFKVLKVKPGTTICHLVLGDVVLWVPAN